MSRIIVEGNKLILEFSDPDKLAKFVEVLRMMGVTNNITERKIIIRYDKGFELYLRNDKNYNERTIRDHMNYLRRLDGKELSYQLYLEINKNKWFVKTIRLYVEYLYKKGEISWEEYNRYLHIFKLRSDEKVNTEEIDVEELISTFYDERAKEVELVLFRILLYSGIRFPEAIKLINEYDEKNLVCLNTHCRYAMHWRRGKKRIDWIFLPKELVPQTHRYRGYYRGRDYHNIERWLDKKYGIKISWFRDLFFRICREVAEKEVCDFVQGRIGKLSVSDKHYDNMLSRADKDYPKVVERINKVIQEALMLMSDGIPEEGIEIVLDNGKVIRSDEIPPFDIPEVDEEEEKRDMWEYNVVEFLEDGNEK